MTMSGGHGQMDTQRTKPVPTCRQLHTHTAERDSAASQYPSRQKNVVKRRYLCAHAITDLVASEGTGMRPGGTRVRAIPPDSWQTKSDGEAGPAAVGQGENKKKNKK
jgi:hypothetical protein